MSYTKKLDEKIARAKDDMSYALVKITVLFEDGDDKEQIGNFISMFRKAHNDYMRAVTAKTIYEEALTEIRLAVDSLFIEDSYAPDGARNAVYHVEQVVNKW